jgi:ParB family chromosome partitioning protein
MTKRGFSFANNPLMQGPALDERSKGGIPYREIPLSAIEADPNQPRRSFDTEKLQELAESIRQYGVISPILVRAAKLPGRYTVISGERRYRAANLAGLATIPAVVSQGDDAQDRTLAMQLVENLQRDDLTPYERALAIGALRDAHSLSVREISERLNISKSAVQRSLDVLNLPDDLLSALKDGAAESKVLLLAKIEDPALRASYLKDMDILSRAELEREIRQPKSVKGPANTDDRGDVRVVSAEDGRLADEIQRSLGLKVRLIRSGAESGAGRLTIEFYGDADLQMVFRKLVAE